MSSNNCFLDLSMINTYARKREKERTERKKINYSMKVYRLTLCDMIYVYVCSIDEAKFKWWICYIQLFVLRLFSSLLSAWYYVHELQTA